MSADTPTPEDITYSPELLPKQKRFAEQYVIDLNGTQAAIRAGYSPNGADVTSSRLLDDTRVAAYIAKLIAQRTSRVNVTADSVLQEMSILANSRLDHYYVDDEGQVRCTEDAPEGAMGAIESIRKKTTIKLGKARDGEEGEVTKTYDVTIKLWDKPAPLKLMGRHVGLFPNKVIVSAPGLEDALKNATNDELAARAAALALEASTLKKGDE